ncbi:SWIM zinc finger family protein [Haloplanus aerogenes]|nr:SWIM zinc finger family protein [Haloplanus aerogenes]
MADPHPLTQLDVSTRVLKRAQYEAFEFTLEPDGVRVRNGSYADPENHEYLVRVADGLPISCTCPADARFAGACKHRLAVAIRRPILTAALNDAGRSRDDSKTDRTVDTEKSVTPTSGADT